MEFPAGMVRFALYTIILALICLCGTDGSQSESCSSMDAFAKTIQHKLTSEEIKDIARLKMDNCTVDKNCSGFTCAGKYFSKPFYVDTVLEYCLPVPVAYITYYYDNKRADKTYVLKNGQPARKTYSTPKNMVKVDGMANTTFFKNGDQIQIHLELSVQVVILGKTVMRKSYPIDRNVTVDASKCPAAPDQPSSKNESTKATSFASHTPTPTSKSTTDSLSVTASSTADAASKSTASSTSSSSSSQLAKSSSSHKKPRSKTPTPSTSASLKQSVCHSTRPHHVTPSKKHGKSHNSSLSAGARAGLIATGICVVIVVIGLFILCRRAHRLSNRPAYYNDISLNDPLRDELNPEEEMNDDDDAPLFGSSHVVLG